MKKAIANIILVTILINLFITKSIANSSCKIVTDNIKYFNATLYNYDARNFNSWARNYPLDHFNQLSIEQRINVDSRHFLFRRCWYQK